MRRQVRDSAGLEGRVALVTGGGRGLGRAHCLELARRGARVAVNDVDEDVAEATAATIRAGGDDAIAVSADGPSRTAVEEIVARVGTHWNALDILVSERQGPIYSETSLAETDDDEWRRMFAVNVDGALFLAPAPRCRGSGKARPSIIITSSQWGQVGPGHSYAYVAAKGALLALAKNLAVELAPDRILVNAIAPRRRAHPDGSRRVRRGRAGAIPIGRLADPEENLPPHRIPRVGRERFHHRADHRHQRRRRNRGDLGTRRIE